VPFVIIYCECDRIPEKAVAVGVRKGENKKGLTSAV
jgi:hypothetical protein